MKTYTDIGIRIPRVFLPKEGVSLKKWAVIACDQYTSEPEYWREVEARVNGSPSTLKMILPEIYLGTEQENKRIHQVRENMRSYLNQDILEPHRGLMYTERQIEGKTRRGVVLALDLEKYDYNKGSQSLIRATEGTIIDRLPPRMKIREGAPLELPHILVLIDDPRQTVIEPLSTAKDRMVLRYDFDLMMDSGRLTGYQVTDPALEAGLIEALRKLADAESFKARYGVNGGHDPMLFAMGDGNHSLATAKAIWEKMKPVVGMNHPSRYALVEIENVHDSALNFEPIHRVLFGLKRDIFTALQDFFGANYAYYPVRSFEEMDCRVAESRAERQLAGAVYGGAYGVIEITQPPTNLAVGTLQNFLDEFMKSGGAEKIDYVHGGGPVQKFGALAGNVGFFLPAMDKNDLFKTVVLDGALPRKTFSMGEAKEKRFYMESRMIV